MQHLVFIIVDCTAFSSDWGYRPDDIDGGVCVTDDAFTEAEEDRGNQQCITGLVHLFSVPIVIKDYGWHVSGQLSCSHVCVFVLGI